MVLEPNGILLCDKNPFNQQNINGRRVARTRDSSTRPAITIMVFVLVTPSNAMFDSFYSHAKLTLTNTPSKSPSMPR